MLSSELYQNDMAPPPPHGAGQTATSKWVTSDAYNGAGGQKPPIEPPSQGLGGGDDGMSDLTTRVAVLETHVEHIRSELGKLSGLPTDVATIKTELNHKPGKGFIVTSAVVTVTALTGIITFADKLQALIR